MTKPTTKTAVRLRRAGLPPVAAGPGPLPCASGGHRPRFPGFLGFPRFPGLSGLLAGIGLVAMGCGSRLEAQSVPRHYYDDLFRPRVQEEGSGPRGLAILEVQSDDDRIAQLAPDANVWGRWGTAGAPAGYRAGQVDRGPFVLEGRKPWSGPGWSYAECNMAFKKYRAPGMPALSPLELLDSWALTVRGSHIGAALFEAESNHNGRKVRDHVSWAGHCDGWAAAAILTPTPPATLEIDLDRDFQSVTLRSRGTESSYSDPVSHPGLRKITLTRGQIKGILTEAYRGALRIDAGLRVRDLQKPPVRQWLEGNPGIDPGALGWPTWVARGQEPADAQSARSLHDPQPHVLHAYVARSLQRQVALACDYENHQAIRNRPIYGYEYEEVSTTRDGDHEVKTFQGRLVCAGGAADDYPGTHEVKVPIEFRMRLADGIVQSSEWASTDHPDNLWFPVEGTFETSQKVNMPVVTNAPNEVWDLVLQLRKQEQPPR